jgi:1-pyrroline-5-carboxylate dehydrogenase
MFAISPSIDVRNEPVRSYAPGSAERAALRGALRTMTGERIELPLVIGGKPVSTGRLETAICPHDHAHVLADAHLAGPAEVDQAVAAAKAAWSDWSRTPWEVRARIFLKAADLVAGPWRDRLNAATMLGQSKTAPQAEIDAAAELADYFRFNVSFMLRIYGEQPISSDGVWNRMDYRPLEGFIYAITPFNFTAIAGNLPAAPALMGNTVVWKPSTTAKYSAHFVMALLQEAGLPDGVINLIYGDGAAVSAQILADPELAGIHFTGSTEVFDAILRDVSARKYRNYPRIVGETGGKNFTLGHPSADIGALATAIVRGGYEYQGQKCSATSRVYAPRSLWPTLRDRLVADIATIRVGDVADFTNFMGAVIDEKSWRRQAAAIEAAAGSATETVIAGDDPDMRVGYFVPPTLIETVDPASRFMTEEFFGPIVTTYVYDDDAFGDMLDTIDAGSAYGLSGSIFARDAGAVSTALDRLRHTAGNVYINDKSAGAVVGQQPFGGARASGTNDKAGSMWNLARWVSPRTIKENFVSPTDYRYPAMLPDGDQG